MFSLERELVDTFISFISNSEFELNISTFHSEFNYQNGKTDIIAKNQDNEIVAFEAKLSNIKKVINQAYRNTSFANFSYIVMPATKYELQKKYLSEIDKLNIGVVLVDNDHAWIEVHASHTKPILPWLNEKASNILSREVGHLCPQAH